jgi:adenosylmethionine-8-amino-7-oxononanoate aminotransferase
MVERKPTQAELEQAAQRHLWLPFTQMREAEDDPPLIIAEAQGCYLRDLQGREYLDGVSSLWVTIHGHRKQAIDLAVLDQIQKAAHTTLLGLAHPPAILLAEKLVTLAPSGLTRVFYSDDGSTAVEVALKMAFQYWQQSASGGATRSKTRFVAFRHAYHGDTLGAVSVGGIDLFHRLYRPLTFETFRAEAPYCYRCPLGKHYPACGIACLGSLEEILHERHGETAAVIIEPLVQAAAGMVTAPPGFLKGVRDLCNRYRVLLIADEVATGFGRTGKLFACEHEGVTPDLMAVAKGLTGGYLPLAATLTTEEIYRAFLGEHREAKTFFHGHSYTGNPLACAAALANLRVFEEERTLEDLQEKIAYLTQMLEEFRKLRHVGDIRQCGFIVGIELVRDRETREPYAWEERIGRQVCREARTHGLILRPLGDVIVLMPPLGIRPHELTRLIDIAYRAIQKVTEGIR